MSQADLAELRQVYEAATKGKMYAIREDGDDGVAVMDDRGVCVLCTNWLSIARLYIAAHNALPALLDELEAAREEVRRLQEVVTAPTYREALALLAGKDARDRHTKLLGAAEELERLASNTFNGNPSANFVFVSDLKQRAAQLRREAGE